MRRALWAAFLCLLAVTPLSASQQRVEHHLSFTDRQIQYVTVRLLLPVHEEHTVLSMPNWTPGSYLIKDYASQVERVNVRGGSGRNLPVHKTAKNNWSIESKDESFIEVNYSVWAGELSVSSSWVESAFALLNGAGIFMYSEGSRSLPQAVILELPSSWSEAHVALPALNVGSDNGVGPSMDTSSGAKGTSVAFLARDFDELVDSPILLGNAPAYRMKVNEQSYALVNQGDESFWDSQRAADDIAKIVEVHQEFWKSNPLDREYLFFNIISNGSGGLEHDYSTVMMSSPWQMRNREDYIRWLSLVSHEFFHVWNVRRLRPQALAQYDYSNETYTRELWLAEGLSSYYDNLLLFRSSLITVEEFFNLLAAEILKYELSPGRMVRSAEQASFDAWIKHYKPDANSINSDISYYRKGSLIGFVTDTAIRKASKQEHSLDDVMREMYRLYGPDGSRSRGYPPRAFEALVNQRAGSKVAEEIGVLLTTTIDPDVDAALDYYGLHLDRNPTRDAAEHSGVPAPTDLGLTWGSVDSMLTVETVVRSGTAAAAGVLPGDELLAINGQRVNRTNIQDRMLRLEPGEVVQLLLVRNGQVLTLPVAAQLAIPDKYRIIIKPDINKREKERMSAWLGMELTFVRN